MLRLQVAGLLNDVKSSSLGPLKPLDVARKEKIMAKAEEKRNFIKVDSKLSKRFGKTLAKFHKKRFSV